MPKEESFPIPLRYTDVTFSLLSLPLTKDTKDAVPCYDVTLQFPRTLSSPSPFPSHSHSPSRPRPCLVYAGGDLEGTVVCCPSPTSGGVITRSCSLDSCLAWSAAGETHGQGCCAGSRAGPQQLAKRRHRGRVQSDSDAGAQDVCHGETQDERDTWKDQVCRACESSHPDRMDARARNAKRGLARRRVAELL